MSVFQIGNVADMGGSRLVRSSPTSYKDSQPPGRAHKRVPVSLKPADGEKIWCIR
jgi:hypothetical protein